MYQKSAHELRDAFISHKVSASEIARYFIKRIESFDQKIQAFLSIFSEQALVRAAYLDKKRSSGAKLGRLAGIPVVVKDNIHISGEKTTCASKILQNYYAPFDSTVVRLLLEEDAIILGKTNLDEFAMGSSTENSHFFSTKNPWNLDCVPGGSSGGSAAAVAARLCSMALGSDTGGSVRQPASFNGIVGFKPTYGRISRHGLVSFASSLDHIGLFTSNVDDAVLFMEIFAKPCRYDATSIHTPAPPYRKEIQESLMNKKIGVPRKFLSHLSSEIQDNFTEALAIFKDLGVEIIDISLDSWKHSIAIYCVIAMAEASTNLARFDGIRYGYRTSNATSLDELYKITRSEGFGSEVKKRILLGTYVLSEEYQNAYYKKAQKIRTLIVQELDKAFQACDIIALPTTPSPAFKLASIRNTIEMYLQDIHTAAANLAGVPAISIPSGFDKSGKPLGLQLIGPQCLDGKVLGFAHHFQQRSNYHKFIPPLFDNEVKE